MGNNSNAVMGMFIPMPEIKAQMFVEMYTVDNIALMVNIWNTIMNMR